MKVYAINRIKSRMTLRVQHFLREEILLLIFMVVLIPIEGFIPLDNYFKLNGVSIPDTSTSIEVLNFIPSCLGSCPQQLTGPSEP